MVALSSAFGQVPTLCTASLLALREVEGLGDGVLRPHDRGGVDQACSSDLPDGRRGALL